MHTILNTTFTAEGAIPAGAVVVAGSTPGCVKLPGAANAGQIIGVAVQSADTGRDVSVAIVGVASCTAGAAIAMGTPVVAYDATGKVGPAGAAANILGIALSAASGDAEAVNVLISPAFRA